MYVHGDPYVYTHSNAGSPNLHLFSVYYFVAIQSVLGKLRPHQASHLHPRIHVQVGTETLAGPVSLLANDSFGKIFKYLWQTEQNVITTISDNRKGAV